MCEVDRLVILANCPGARAGVDRHPGATGGRSPSWTSPGEVKSPVSSIWDGEEGDEESVSEGDHRFKKWRWKIAGPKAEDPGRCDQRVSARPRWI